VIAAGTTVYKDVPEAVLVKQKTELAMVQVQEIS
jgi:bifunctional N-acetylglucosamine-1-phosphate-uridyltransferase/glucosamine-1-phosphate-acetyltransferase GlmU-like protein